MYKKEKNQKRKKMWNKINSVLQRWGLFYTHTQHRPPHVTSLMNSFRFFPPQIRKTTFKWNNNWVAWQTLKQSTSFRQFPLNYFETKNKTILYFYFKNSTACGFSGSIEYQLCLTNISNAKQFTKIAHFSLHYRVTWALNKQGFKLKESEWH